MTNIILTIQIALNIRFKLPLWKLKSIIFIKDILKFKNNFNNTFKKTNKLILRLQNKKNIFENLDQTKNKITLKLSNLESLPNKKTQKLIKSQKESAH